MHEAVSFRPGALATEQSGLPVRLAGLLRSARNDVERPADTLRPAARPPILVPEEIWTIMVRERRTITVIIPDASPLLTLARVGRLDVFRHFVVTTRPKP